MSIQNALDDITDELDNAVNKFPTWPTRALDAVAVLNEEVGELNKDILQRTYEPNKGVTKDDIRKEAVQTAAMALRFILSLDQYDYSQGEQHDQRAT